DERHRRWEVKARGDEQSREVEGRKEVKEMSIEGKEARVGEESRMVQVWSTMVTEGDEDEHHHKPHHNLHLSQHLHLTTLNDETTSRPQSQTQQLHKPMQMPCMTQGVKQMHQEASPRVYSSRGRRIGQTSLNIEVNEVEMDDDHVEEDHNTQTAPRDPVGTPDGIERHPDEPPEPPDNKEGDKSKVEMRVETVKQVEMKELSPVDQPGGRGDERVKMREAEGKERGQSKDDNSQ
ncbi:hypothetical protein BDN67DRAFT_986322, partial [Paxillus ammoniavirescens]